MKHIRDLRFLDPLWITLTWVLDHLVEVYAAVAIVAWVFLSGLSFANQRALSHELDLPSHRQCLDDAAFSLVWSAMEASFWPIGAPAAYVLNDFGVNGWQLPLPRSCQ